jgi:hypothetical protein
MTGNPLFRRIFMKNYLILTVLLSWAMAFSAGASGDMPEFTVDTTPSKFMESKD